MYYVYVLQSQKDKKLYKGFTTNLEARLAKHNSGNVISTKSRRPLKIIYWEEFENSSDAIQREKFFKTYLGGIELKKILEKEIKHRGIG